MEHLPGPDWLLWCAGAVLLGGIFYRPVIRPVWLFVQAIVQFLADWNGIPARPGHEAQLGVLAILADFRARLRLVEHEVRQNNGGSLKDQVGRIETRAAQIETKVDVAAQAAETARELAAEVQARVGPWLDGREEELESYRSSLVEIGYVDPNLARRDPRRRDRAQDRRVQ